jgi:hypothetical protein
MMPRILCRLSGLLAIAWSTAAVAQQPVEIRCPDIGTKLRFSTSGSMLEVIQDLGGGVCRYRNPTTNREFTRFLTLDTTSPIFSPNLERLATLNPLEVGKSVSIPYSGPANRGGDGAWDITISVEKFETVKVPIGNLPAYVILQDERSFGTQGRWLRRWWYSPVIRYAVQFEFVTLRGSPPTPYPQNWQLTEVALR